MALSRLNYNSLNVTPTASKGIGFDSGADDLAATFSGGSMRFIKKLTSDGSDDTLDFVDGASDVVLDDTYKEYMFIFNDIHPETDEVDFTFNLSIDTGSNYNVAKTTTTFYGYHDEGDTAAALAYIASHDLAQGTGFQQLGDAIGNDNDQCCSGYLHLFNPSSTTFVKHFIASMNTITDANYSVNEYTAGYGNTTSAVDAIQFKMSSGEIQGGTISLYGIN